MRLDAGGSRPSAGRFSAACLFGDGVGVFVMCRLRLASVATVLALCGCQSTQERSAELQLQAKHDVLASQGVSVTKQNPSVKVLQSAVVRSA